MFSGFWRSWSSKNRWFQDFGDLGVQEIRGFRILEFWEVRRKDGFRILEILEVRREMVSGFWRSWRSGDRWFQGFGDLGVQKMGDFRILEILEFRR